MFKTLALSVNSSFSSPQRPFNFIELNLSKKPDGHYNELTQVLTFDEFVSCSGSCYLKKDPRKNRFFSLIKTAGAIHVITNRSIPRPSFNPDFTISPTPEFLRSWWESRLVKGHNMGSGSYKRARESFRIPLDAHHKHQKVAANFSAIHPSVLLKATSTGSLVEELHLQGHLFSNISPKLFEEKPLHLQECSVKRAKETVYIPTEYYDINLLTLFGKVNKDPLYRCVNFLPSLLTSTEHVGEVHSKGYIHRDINPKNFVCRPDTSPRLDIKITDFGCAVLEKDAKANTIHGSLGYVAPEIIEGKAASRKSDIWSLASHIVFCLTNEHIIPIKGCEGSKTLVFKKTLHYDPTRCSVLNKIPFPSLTALLSKMLNKTPSERPDTDEVIDTLLQIVRGINHIRQSLTTILSADLEAPLTDKDRTTLESLSSSIETLYRPSLLDAPHQQALYNKLSNIRKNDLDLPLTEDERFVLISLESSMKTLYDAESSAALMELLQQSDVTQTMLSELPIWHKLCAIKPPSITQDTVTSFTNPSEDMIKRDLMASPLGVSLHSLATTGSWDGFVPEKHSQTMNSLSSRIRNYLTLIEQYTETYQQSGIAPLSPINVSHILQSSQRKLLQGHFGAKRLDLGIALNAERSQSNIKALKLELEDATKAHKCCYRLDAEIQYESNYFSSNILHDLFRELDVFHSCGFIFTHLDPTTIYTKSNQYRFSAHDGFFNSEVSLPTKQKGPFIAPELRIEPFSTQEQYETEASNIWALGVVLFNNYLLHQLDSAVLRQGTIIDPASPEGRDLLESIQDETLKAMFTLILSEDPTDRPPLYLLTDSDPGSLKATLEMFFAVKTELRPQNLFKYLQDSFKRPDQCKEAILVLHNLLLEITKGRIKSIQDEALKAMLTLTLSEDPADRPPLCLLTDPSSLKATLEAHFTIDPKLRVRDLFGHLRDKFHQPNSCKEKIAALHQSFLAMAKL